MSAVPAPAKLDVRQRVLGFLEFVSVPEQVSALEQVASRAEIAQALSELWFEQIYTPSLNYVDALRGDRNSPQDFSAIFETDELEALERFHRFFELRIERLPKREEGVSGLAASPAWQHILKDAANTLYFLQREDGGRAERLRWTLEALRGLLGCEPLALP